MIRLIVVVTAVVVVASLASTARSAQLAPPSAEEAARIVAATRERSTVAPAGSECAAAELMAWVDYHGYRLITRNGSTEVERILRRDPDGTVHTQGPDGEYTYGTGDPMPITSPDGSVERMELCPG